MAEFDGKVVIVTGGAKGIGEGICRAFAGEGAQVLCADVDAAAGKALAAESFKGDVRFSEGDVSSGEVCRKLVETAAGAWGGVDIICNNAGIQPTHCYLPADQLPEEKWDRIIDVNLKSYFLMAKYCIPEFRKRGGGVIINTASVQGLQSAKGVSAYAASKGGILSLTRNLALEYAEENIRVVAVNPGAILTPLLDEAIGDADRDEFLQSVAEAHPIGRYGLPADIANAFLFLASESASFITGEYLCVDGGMMAKGAWA